MEETPKKNHQSADAAGAGAGVEEIIGAVNNIAAPETPAKRPWTDARSGLGGSSSAQAAFIAGASTDIGAKQANEDMTIMNASCGPLGSLFAVLDGAARLALLLCSPAEIVLLIKQLVLDRSFTAGIAERTSCRPSRPSRRTLRKRELGQQHYSCHSCDGCATRMAQQFTAETSAARLVPAAFGSVLPAAQCTMTRLPYGPWPTGVALDGGGRLSDDAVRRAVVKGFMTTDKQYVEAARRCADSGVVPPPRLAEMIERCGVSGIRRLFFVRSATRPTTDSFVGATMPGPASYSLSTVLPYVAATGGTTERPQPLRF